MKRIITIAAIILAGMPLFAQNTKETLKTRYERLVRNLGYAGVGIENVLDQWEELDPNDCEMIEARFNYHLARSKRTEAVPKMQDKFLGNAPVMSLPDNTGNKVNYFEEDFYDINEFGLAVSNIEKAIRLKPLELQYRVDWINALIAYEKEQPDMALAQIITMIDMDSKSGIDWTIAGKPAGEGDFPDLIQQYCFVFFKIGSPASYEAFNTISTRMSKLYKDKLDFQCNQGSYWLVAKQNPQKAKKIYEKVLKSDPENVNALQNLVILAKKSKNSEMEKEYRQKLANIQNSDE